MQSCHQHRRHCCSNAARVKHKPDARPRQYKGLDLTRFGIQITVTSVERFKGQPSASRLSLFAMESGRRLKRKEFSFSASNRHTLSFRLRGDQQAAVKIKLKKRIGLLLSLEKAKGQLGLLSLIKKGSPSGTDIVHLRTASDDPWGVANIDYCITGLDDRPVGGESSPTTRSF